MQKSRENLDLTNLRNEDRIQKITQAHSQEVTSLKNSIKILRQEIDSFDQRINEAVQSEQRVHLEEIRQLRTTLTTTRTNLEKKAMPIYKTGFKKLRMQNLMRFKHLNPL